MSIGITTQFSFQNQNRIGKRMEEAAMHTNMARVPPEPRPGPSLVQPGSGAGPKKTQKTQSTRTFYVSRFICCHRVALACEHGCKAAHLRNAWSPLSCA